MLSIIPRCAGDQPLDSANRSCSSSGTDANAEPWPGLLSGGPSRDLRDPAMKGLAAGLPPARLYVDDQGSYASNGTAIAWNAPLAFLLAGLRR